LFSYLTQAVAAREERSYGYCSKYDPFFKGFISLASPVKASLLFDELLRQVPEYVTDAGWRLQHAQQPTVGSQVITANDYRSSRRKQFLLTSTQ
jgi:hypothetical protein